MALPMARRFTTILPAMTLAHHGVRCLDELPGFRRQVLEVWRQPLEDGRAPSNWQHTWAGNRNFPLTRYHRGYGDHGWSRGAEVGIRKKVLQA